MDGGYSVVPPSPETPMLLSRSLLIAAALLPFHAQALVLGGSNLGFEGYPAPQCTKPERPTPPASQYDKWGGDRYNAELERYQRDRERHIACIEKYLDNAKNDAQRIQERMQGAVRATEAP